MIKCTKSKTQIKGSIIDTVQDFTNIIRAVKVTLENDMDKEAAAEIMAMCGRLAFSEDEDSKRTLLNNILDALIENKI